MVGELALWIFVPCYFLFKNQSLKAAKMAIQMWVNQQKKLYAVSDLVQTSRSYIHVVFLLDVAYV